MRKNIALILILSCSIQFLSAATTSTIPAAIQDWYQDVIGLINTLAKDLETAKDPKGVAKAFATALLAIQSKRIAEKRIVIETQFSSYFDKANGDGADSSPQGDWGKLNQDFSPNFVAKNNKLF